MPILQVKDCPQELYDGLRKRAEKDHRSIAQQCVVAVEQHLSGESHQEEDARRKRRAAILDRVAARKHTVMPDDLADYAEIVREIRDER